MIYTPGVLARYDPTLDVWLEPIELCDPRQDASLVWTGDEMLAWGGAWVEPRPCAGQFCESEFAEHLLFMRSDGTVRRADAAMGPAPR